jgi:WD40 repeat protein
MPGLSCRANAGAGAMKRWSFDAEDHVVGVGWSPDSALVAVLTGSGTLFILESRDGGVIHELTEAHAIGALTLDWSEAGLATGGQDGKIRLWDAARGSVLETFDGADGDRCIWVEEVRWSPDGTRLATRAGKVLRVWKPGAGERFLEYGEHSTTISALCWRPDSKGISVGLYGGAFFYRLSENKPHREIRWKGSILSLAWSPNARYLAAGTQEATVNFWKLPYRVGEELNMSGYSNKIKELAWDPASRFLATGGSEVVTVWDVSGKGPRGTRPKELHRHTKKVTLLAWQSQGGLLLSGSADGTSVLWNPEGSHEPLYENSLGGVVTCATWAFGDRSVVIGSASGQVEIWGAAPRLRRIADSQ